MIGILDTNADPDELQFPIPGNDDAIRSVSLLTRIIADAAAEGLIERHQKPETAGNVSAVEPLAEWERELLEAPAAETEAPAAEATPAADEAPVGATVAENDADAQVAAKADEAADITPEHAPETAEQVEAAAEAEAK